MIFYSLCVSKTIIPQFASVISGCERWQYKMSALVHYSGHLINKSKSWWRLQIKSCPFADHLLCPINETSTRERAHFCRKYLSNYKKLQQTRRPQFNIGKLRGTQKAFLSPSVCVSLASESDQPFFRTRHVCLCHWRASKGAIIAHTNRRDGCGVHKLCSQ